MAFPIITGVAFTNSPFYTSYSKILGIVITVRGIKSSFTEGERLYTGGTEVGIAVFNKPVR